MFKLQTSFTNFTHLSNPNNNLVPWIGLHFITFHCMTTPSLFAGQTVLTDTTSTQGRGQAWQIFLNLYTNTPVSFTRTRLIHDNVYPIACLSLMHVFATLIRFLRPFLLYPTLELQGSMNFIRDGVDGCTDPQQYS